MILRTKHIEALKELAESSSSRYIAIRGEDAVKIEEFLHEMKWSGVFHSEHIEAISLSKLENHPSMKPDTKYIVITGGVIENLSHFQTIIEPLLHENIVWVFFAAWIDFVWDEESELYTLPPLSFREYAEYRWSPIDISLVMRWGADIGWLNLLRDEYIKSGWYPLHIEDDSSIFRDFEWKSTIMKQELYKKEYSDFDEYLRTLAMNTGNLFKADQLAKLLGISRRKIHKYTELLMEHGIIKPLGPWWDHAETETTRHVKIYFTELYYLRAILGDIHYQWQMKQGALENFVLIELLRKLEGTHDFYFYRKKSGAEITFVMVNKENTLITPIEVTVRDTDALSQALRTFDSDYHARVERYMVINNSRSEKKSLEEKQVMILPHIGI